MNSSSLARKGRARTASKVRKKNGQIFGTKMFGLPLYLLNAAPSTMPIKSGSNGTADEMRKKWQKKREERGRKNGGRKCQKKKNLHSHTFFHRDPCAMTFRECKILAVLDCEE